MNEEIERIAALQAEVANLKQRVAELEKSESKAHKERDHFRQILEYVPFIIMATDKNGLVTFWNTRAEVMTGYSASEICQNPQVVELFYPDPEYRNYVIEQWQSYFETGQSLELDFTAKDGEYRNIIWHNISQSIPEPGELVWYIGQDITQRKIQEQELLIFKTVVESATDGIGIGNLDGCITYANAAFGEITGYGEDVTGMAIPQLHPEDMLPYVQSSIEQVMHKGSWHGEIAYLRPDGTQFPCQITTYRIDDENGQPMAVSAIVRDITKQKQFQEELQTFQALVENSPDAIGIADPTGTTIYANTAFRDLFGYGDATIGTNNVLFFREQERQTQVLELINSVVSQGSWSGNSFGVRQDGHTFPMQVTTFALYDEHGAPRALPAIVRDLSDQHRQEQAIRDSEERLRTVIEKLPIGMCITNTNYIFEFVNPAYCQLYGYSKEELIGKSFTMVVEEAYRKNAEELHNDFIQKGAEVRGEWQVVGKNGRSITALVDAAAIVGEDGQPKKATFVVDITDRKMAEQEREALQQQIIEAQQSAIRELSTPLIPLSKNVVLMPLVGSIDSSRAQLVMETLLEGISEYQAETAILDITGVSVVDTQVANALIQAAQAVKLLGAKVVLTGIGPTMAQTLVHLGADLSSIVTRGSLQSAVLDALLS